MEVYLIRHTRPEITTGICYGQTDLALASSFPEEKKAVKAQLPTRLEAVYTSPLQRCRLLAEALPADVLFVNAALQELNFGQWEMCDWNAIPPEQLNPWMEDFVNIAPTGGESFEQMKVRVMACWQEIADAGYKKVALVTHAGVIRLLVAVLNEKPLKDAFQLQVDYGQVICFEHHRTIN